MSEFIGSRISLVSNSDIRYVGTLHEINSEKSTVALQSVTSYGTEGRKGNPDEEIPPSGQVYEYIVFRGSDVKDLRIEEVPEKENRAPQVPDDPAIVNAGRPPPQARSSSSHASQQASQSQGYENQQQQGGRNNSAQGGGPPASAQGPQNPGPSNRAPGGPAGNFHGGPPSGQALGPHSQPQFENQPHFPQPYYLPPPPSQWGRGGPPPGPGYSGPPYGPPGGWYPPPGQAPFPQPGYGNFPPGQPGFAGPPDFRAMNQHQKSQAIGSNASTHQNPSTGSDPVLPVEKPADSHIHQAAPAAELSTASVTAGKSGATGEATLAKTQVSSTVNPTAKKGTPLGPKSGGRIVPAIPLQSPAVRKAHLETVTGEASKASSEESRGPGSSNTAAADATKAATAAVAAAMAKLPPLGGQNANGAHSIENLTKKTQETTITDNIRAPRQPGSGSGFRGERVERARGRGGRSQVTRKVEVPTTDFDFEQSNAKFNKGELVKEATAGSPIGEPGLNGGDLELNADSPVTAAPSYNKKSSFFDDLSSDHKDRAEAGRPGGREWRGEEQKKNLETFGQGSVDNGGYRGGFRGRGRGRGGRGRGFGGQRGASGFRGGRGEFVPTTN